MFKPSISDKAFDEMLVYLKDIKQQQPVPFTEFVDYFMPTYRDTYTLMKRLKEKDYISYNETYSSTPVSITEIGVDFITNNSFTKTSKTNYENNQFIKDSFHLNKKSLFWVVIGVIVGILTLVATIYFGCYNTPTK
jgi:hypothetical protein